MTKKDWFKDAEYIYYSPSAPESDITTITFKFPNAASGPLVFSTWLYKHGDGKVVGKNLEAEMLQCYIDRDLIDARKLSQK